MTYLLALDQGTSSSRAIVFSTDGHMLGMAQQAFRQIYPQPGWVEHDPQEIWSSQWACVVEALQKAGIGAHQIAAIGITNQRETTLVWDRRTGQPVCNAIVWQDRRTEPMCATLREQGMEPAITQKTGLRLDAYFSATKLRWILDHIPNAQARAEAGELAFGTVDSWLIWQLTGGAQHLTDVSNASRTLLFNVHEGRWDSDLLNLLQIPEKMLPQVLPSSADFGQVAAHLLPGKIKIAGVAGDQQAALFGQTCFTPGQVKNTYGTGCFMLMHTGRQARHSAHGLITTRAAQPDTTPAFALEGSVFIGGALVQWLRDQLHAFNTSADIEALAASVADSDGVIIVPAFTGLGAPYWRADARGSIQGLTRGSTLAHIARAALESIALQSTALLRAMQADTADQQGLTVRDLRVDGGACANDLLMQIQADLMGIPISRPAIIETTALGAAWLAGVGCGLIADVQELTHAWRIERVFEPSRPAAWAEEKMGLWEGAVAKS